MLEKQQDEKQQKQERADEKRKAKAAATPKADSDKPKLTYEERKEMSRLENKIKKLEERKEGIINKFNDTDLSAEEIEKLSKELSEVKDEIEEKEMLWLELAELA